LTVATAAEYLTKLALAIKQKTIADNEIARIIGRPCERGHVGEYIAARVFAIALHASASHKGADGHFAEGNLAARTVNVKWYGKGEGLLDIATEAMPDFYLVMTGPSAAAVSSRGATRPWLISDVYLFDAAVLVERLRTRAVKIGIATSVAKELWEAAEIYPAPRNELLTLSDEQTSGLALFG
jgi:hypothetical protein